jgi:hypothetical protein
MKKIAYIAIGIATLVALFFAGKEIYWQIRLSKAVATLSQRYVYFSWPREDPPYAPPEEIRLRQTKHLIAFQLFYHAASDRRIRKEMYSLSPSMRVYAYVTYLSKTKDVDFNYLVEQLKFRDEIRYTDYDFRENGCFACDVMLYCASSSKYAPGRNLFYSQITGDLEYGLTQNQADSLLSIMYQDEDYADILRDNFVSKILEKIANGGK